ncbi:MAG: MgtC/SapB family protein [Gemmatimonadaceae bacterium]|nr:MgtC/SapB family protein [Gemmatimonadaceae bacterium]
MLDLALAFDLFVAVLVGLAVGIEREWSGHTQGPDGRFGGARTFALLGAIGGIAGWFLRLGHEAAGAALIAGALVFVIVAYQAAMKRPGTTPDSTTEVAALLVIAMGVTSGLAHRSIASATAAVAVVLLAEKSKLQALLGKVAPNEMRAALQFAVLALVVLPLIPDGAFGPYDAFRPRQLWIVVLVFSAINFAGYIARRVIGETHGLAVTGLLGGLVSSTAVTLTFSRRSRDDAALALPLALGVVAACTVLIPRVVVISTMLQPAVGGAVVPVLAPAFAMGLALIGFVLWRERSTRPSTDGPRDGVEASLGQNPLGLWSSLQMAVAFQIVLFAIAWVQRAAGDAGVLASATLLGLTDMDALTVSMARYGADAARVPIAAAAIGIGVLSNTVLKCTMALILGAPGYRWHVAIGLLTIGAGVGLGLALSWP